MAQRPTTRIKIGLRAALRRRYSYAALRVLRRAAWAAIADHNRRSIAVAEYASELDELVTLYWRALQRLRKRWPGLDLADERGQP